MGTKRRIDDYGEKIGGARKDHYGNLSLTNLAELTEEEQVKITQKQNVWPRPDYAKLMEDGTDRKTALAIKCIYDSIGNSPTVPRFAPADEARRNYISGIAALRQIGEARNVAELRDACKAANSAIADRRDAIHSMASNAKARGLLGNVLDAVRWWDGALPYAIERKADAVLRRNADWPQSRQLWAIMAAKRDLAVGPAASASQFAKSQYETEAGHPIGDDKWVILRHGMRIALPVVDGEATSITEAVWDSEDEAAKVLERWMEDCIKQGDGLNLRRPALPPSKCVRVGPQTPRQGEDVTEARLAQEFGLRAVEFGNWAEQKHRQAALNMTYDAFADLADLLQVEHQEIGLGNTLAMAYGARGRGGNAAAHYEPSRTVINLTKTSGAGALAHEWFHAFDHFLGKRAGGDTYLSGQVDVGLVRRFSRDVDDPRQQGLGYMMDSLSQVWEKPASPRERMDTHFEQWHSAVRMARYHIGTMTEQMTDEDVDPAILSVGNAMCAVLDKASEQAWGGKPKIRKISAHPDLDKLLDTLPALRYDAKLVRGYMAQMNDAYEGVIQCRNEMLAGGSPMDAHPLVRTQFQQVATPFAIKAKAIDALKGGEYWGTKPEMAARAFESWVHDRLGRLGRTNAYLASYTTDSHYGNSGLYPAGSERLRITAALDAFAQRVAHVIAPRAVSLSAKPLRMPKPAPLQEVAASRLAVGSEAMVRSLLENQKVDDAQFVPLALDSATHSSVLEHLSKRRMGEQLTDALLAHPAASSALRGRVVLNSNSPPEYWVRKVNEGVFDVDVEHRHILDKLIEKPDAQAAVQAWAARNQGKEFLIVGRGAAVPVSMNEAFLASVQLELGMDEAVLSAIADCIVDERAGGQCLADFAARLVAADNAVDAQVPRPWTHTADVLARALARHEGEEPCSQALAAMLNESTNASFWQLATQREPLMVMPAQALAERASNPTHNYYVDARVKDELDRRGIGIADADAQSHGV